jgi:sec-independent protein translocase protein TatB
MFDVGFSEIVVIAVVALVVLGPEKLPKTARTLGHLFGRLQRYVNDVKGDIKRELELDELRKLQQNVQSTARELEESMTSATRDMEAGVRDVESALSATGASPPAAPAAEAASGAAANPSPPAPTPAPAASPAPAEPARQASLPGFDRG